MRLSAVNGIKKSEGGDWKIDLHRNKMIEFRGWSVLVGLRRTARDIATARISSEGLSMRTNARPGKVGARHASKPRTERIACRRLHPLTTLSPNDYLSTHLASLLPWSSSFRYLSPSLWIAHILPSFFPLLSLFSFTSRRRLTVVPCFLYRLAPVLRAIQPTLYEKTLKSFFATGRASWLLLQPETAATVSSDAIRKLGENASIYACNVYIYIHERKLRDTRSPQSCQIRSSPLSFYTIRFLGRFHSHFLFVRYEEGRRGANYHSDLSRSNAKVD